MNKEVDELKLKINNMATEIESLKEQNEILAKKISDISEILKRVIPKCLNTHDLKVLYDKKVFYI
jgi:chaperonin cofactor prefoldin